MRKFVFVLVMVLMVLEVSIECADAHRRKRNRHRYYRGYTRSAMVEVYPPVVVVPPGAKVEHSPGLIDVLLFPINLVVTGLFGKTRVVKEGCEKDDVSCREQLGAQEGRTAGRVATGDVKEREAYERAFAANAPDVQSPPVPGGRVYIPNPSPPPRETTEEVVTEETIVETEERVDVKVDINKVRFLTDYYSVVGATREERGALGRLLIAIQGEGKDSFNIIKTRDPKLLRSLRAKFASQVSGPDLENLDGAIKVVEGALEARG